MVKVIHLENRVLLWNNVAQNETPYQNLQVCFTIFVVLNYSSCGYSENT